MALQSSVLVPLVLCLLGHTDICKTTLRCILFCLIYFDCLRFIVPCPVTAVRSVWQLWILLLVIVVPVGLKTLKFSVSLKEALRLGLLPQTCGDLVFQITFYVEPLCLACCMQLINLPDVPVRQHVTCMNGYWRPDPSVYSLCQLICLHSGLVSGSASAESCSFLTCCSISLSGFCFSSGPGSFWTESCL